MPIKISINRFFFLFTKYFWYGKSNLKLFFDCPYQIEGGFVLYCTEGEDVISVGVQKYIITKNAEMVVLPGITFCLLQSTENFANRIFVFSTKKNSRKQELYHQFLTYRDRSALIIYYKISIPNITNLNYVRIFTNNKYIVYVKKRINSRSGTISTLC